ncbi:MAG: condensation domain-containing protein, partial [Thermoanaerobaculia bacterium]
TRSPEAFHELLARCEVTVLNQTPSAFRQLIAEDASSAAALRLRLVIFGGEALEPGMLRPWFERHGDETPRLVNMYGITETTVHVPYHPVSRADLLEPTVSVIGRPIPDLRVHVLDRHLNLCPIGVAGELSVSGAGLARGYLNRPELTREKFVANPFGAQPGDRLYRSGDLGRYLPDGQLQHLGRIDQQVKIRGHRIELGEIESVLGGHPEVRDAVVTAREDSPGDRRLVAYVIAVAGASPTASELRAFLKRDLPDYMIPAHFVPLDRLPLTANGKVDLRALPPPDGARRENEDLFVAPRTSAEEVLAAIWSQVLKTERVGIHDNFFDLGGDSILSIQIVARANQTGLRLSPRQVFAHQTVAELALAAEEGKAPIPPDHRKPVTGLVPLTPVQRWFLEGCGAHVDHFNQAFLLEAPRDLDRALLETAVRHLLFHHDALRLRLKNERGDWKQTIVAAEEKPVLASVDLSGVAPSEQDARMEAAAAEVQASLNTAHGPIVRFVSFDLGPGAPGRLLVVIHHLGVDGVSWHILLEDLEVACRQLGAGKEVVFPAKTTSVRQWAELLRDYAQSETVARELGYWLERAECPSSPIPLDHVAGPNIESSARKLSSSLTAEETDALLQEVPSAYRTQINDVLLAALVKAFDPWTTSGPLLIDLEGHGREDVVSGVDLSRTVGWFTTIFPVRLNFDGRSSLAEVLKGVKEELRAIPEKGIGYGLLRYLSADPEVRERLQSLPQAQVSFNYLGQFHRGSSASLFSIADGPTGPAHAPEALRRHVLGVNGIVLDGRLRIEWTYSENLHRRTTIEALAERYVEALRSLIAHCRSLSETSFTPSDFPLAGLKQERLDRILRKFGRE